MLPKQLAEEIKLEVELLRELLDGATDIVAKVKADQPDPTDKLAAGSLLQSFYNGIEKIFRSIAEHADNWKPKGQWRHELIDLMSRPTSDRDALLDDELRKHVDRLKDFREAYRYSHFFRLEWNTVAAMLMNLDNVMQVLCRRIDVMLRDGGLGPLSDQAYEELPNMFWAEPKKSKKPNGSRPLAIASLLSLAFGLWIGLTGTLIYYRISPPQADVQYAPSHELLASVSQLQKSPGYKTLCKYEVDTLEQLFGNAKLISQWQFFTTRGQLDGMTVSEFTGEIMARSDHNLPVNFKYIKGKLVCIETNGEVYRIHRSKLVRYEYHDNTGYMPLNVYDFDHLGHLVRKSTNKHIANLDYWDADRRSDKPLWKQELIVNKIPVTSASGDFDGRVRNIEVLNGKKITTYKLNRNGEVTKVEEKKVEAAD